MGKSCLDYDIYDSASSTTYEIYLGGGLYTEKVSLLPLVFQESETARLRLSNRTNSMRCAGVIPLSAAVPNAKVEVKV